MALTLTDLETTFKRDVQWFNGGKFPPPGDPQYDRFDPAVRMKQIDDPVIYHTTRPAVEKYFDGNGNKDRAEFIPDDIPAFPKYPASGQPNYQVVGSLGFVSGTADFIDSRASKTPKRRIAYSFTYTGVTGDWKAIHLWGQYISP
jgi:hypothetical protein